MVIALDNKPRTPSAQVKTDGPAPRLSGKREFEDVRTTSSSSSVMSAFSKQDGAYLNAARKAEQSLSSNHLSTNRSESTKQFAIGEVIKGEGRAVYSLDDQNKAVAAINAAFATKDGSRFTGTLEEKLKSFQKEVVEGDRALQALEARLNANNKTLIDGLVGPLTVQWMVDRGMLRIDRKGELHVPAHKNHEHTVQNNHGTERVLDDGRPGQQLRRSRFDLPRQDDLPRRDHNPHITRQVNDKTTITDRRSNRVTYNKTDFPDDDTAKVVKRGHLPIERETKPKVNQDNLTTERSRNRNPNGKEDLPDDDLKFTKRGTNLFGRGTQTIVRDRQTDKDPNAKVVLTDEPVKIVKPNTPPVEKEPKPIVSYNPPPVKDALEIQVEAQIIAAKTSEQKLEKEIAQATKLISDAEKTITPNLEEIKRVLAITDRQRHITGKVQFSMTDQLYISASKGSLENSKVALDKIIDQQAILQENLVRVEKMLSESQQKSDQERKEIYQKASRLLGENAKSTETETTNLGSVVARAKVNIDDLNQRVNKFGIAYNEFRRAEIDTRRGLATGDHATIIKYVEKYMPWVNEDHAKDRWTPQHAVFANAFSKDPLDSYNLYKTIASGDQYGARSALSFALPFAGNHQNFVRNLESLSTDTQIGAKERTAIANYVTALKSCDSLGIENPLRFSPQNLIAIVNERNNPQTDKPLMVITAAKSDHNGAFINLNLVADKYRAQGYRIQYHEVALDVDIETSLAAATSKGRFQADALCLAGHGSKTAISLSDKDPRLNRVDDYDRVIDFNDSEKLKPAGKYLKLGAAIIVNSCSTGEGEKDTTDKVNNIANFLREVFPHMGKGHIYAPVAPGNIDDIIFKDGKPERIRSTNKKGNEVKTYQASTFSFDPDQIPA